MTKESKTKKKKKRKKEKLDATTYVRNLWGTLSVPTCYMDIWKAHSIFLNLLNFSRLPSCLGWYGSCHLQHDRVALVRTKGWQQWNEFHWLTEIGLMMSSKSVSEWDMFLPTASVSWDKMFIIDVVDFFFFLKYSVIPPSCLYSKYRIKAAAC